MDHPVALRRPADPPQLALGKDKEMKDGPEGMGENKKEPTNCLSLEGKVAIVTGSGQGIGKAIALTFAKAGADLAITDINPVTAEFTASAINDLGRRSLAVSADVCENSQVEKMVNETIQKFGGVDILVNNAGGGFPTVPLLEMAEEAWDKVVTLNLKSTFLCCRAVGRVMVKQRRGSVINMASMAGLGPLPLGTNYGAAKAGVKNLTETLAMELAPYRVRVNALAPGPIETPMTAELYQKDPELREQRLKNIPLKRLGKPEDIANLALFLASDASDYITGQTILVNGGLPTFVTPEILSDLSNRF